VLCHPVFFLPSVFEIITTHKVKKNMAKEASGTGAIIWDGTGGMGRHLSWFCQNYANLHAVRSVKYLSQSRQQSAI